MKISLVVVCHYSSQVLAECISRFRSEADAAGVRCEVVAIEQSDDPDEAARVADFHVDRIEVRPNRGYAAGLNAGIELATGTILMLANPDTVMCAGSVGNLIAAVEAGYDVVGPQLVWDDGGELLFPPAENPAPMAELWRTLRLRWQWPWSSGLAGMIDGWWRQWTADQAVEVDALRGPLLVASKEALQRFGRFNEEYFLYYEETEWLWRARRRGARLAIAGNARVVHRAGHSTARAGNREAIEEASRERFFRRNYGASWRWLLRRCAVQQGRTGVTPTTVSGPDDLPQIAPDLWLVSTLRSFMPAVGVVARSDLPPEFANVATGGPWYALAATRSSGHWKIDGSWKWGQ